MSLLQFYFFKRMKVGAELQRLFFQGKQLENDYSLFDYNVKVIFFLFLIRQFSYLFFCFRSMISFN